MDKQQVLSFIEGQLATGKISREDLKIFTGDSSMSQPIGSAPYSPTSQALPTKHESSKNLINTFYAIGAIIVTIGVGILIAQHWDEIGFLGRIVVTAGISF